MDLSIYISLFNITKHSFPWQESLDNAAAFAEEVVVAINTSEDDTFEVISSWAADKPHVKIIKTAFAYDDIEFDGKVKNAALQVCTKDILIQMDADEIIPLGQKKRWVAFANKLYLSNIECYMIPSVDLYGSRDDIRNIPIGNKFRMHKQGFRRGVWAGGRLGDKIDTSKSDTCELINDKDHLVRCAHIVPEFALQPRFCAILDDYIYTVHLGYLSLQHRANINKALWADHWRLRSGHEENVETDVDKLAAEPIIKHNLRLA